MPYFGSAKSRLDIYDFDTLSPIDMGGGVLTSEPFIPFSIPSFEPEINTVREQALELVDTSLPSFVNVPLETVITVKEQAKVLVEPPVTKTENVFTNVIQELVKIPANVIEIFDSVVTSNSIVENKSPVFVNQVPEPAFIEPQKLVNFVGEQVQQLIKIPGNMLDFFDSGIKDNTLFEAQKDHIINVVPEPVTFNSEKITLLDNNYKAGILSEDTPIKTLIPAISVPVQNLVLESVIQPKQEAKTFDLKNPWFIGLGLLLLALLIRKK